MSTDSKICFEALRYAERGWHVFPCHHIEDGRCTCVGECASPGKHPMTPHGFKDATTDKDRIQEWWSQFPSANIGIRTGEVSGVWVLDLDGAGGIAHLV